MAGKMTMHEVQKYVGGVARGVKRQLVREVKVDADGNLSVLMVVPDEHDPIGPPTQTQIEQEMEQMDMLAAAAAEKLRGS